MQKLTEWAQGNPGALTFLMEVYLNKDQSALGIAIAVDEKLQRCDSIRGTDLYVLWSDLCNKDLEKVKQLCQNCPDEILTDACSRQDYSGKPLVEKYFKTQDDER